MVKCKFVAGEQNKIEKNKSNDFLMDSLVGIRYEQRSANFSCVRPHSEIELEVSIIC